MGRPSLYTYRYHEEPSKVITLIFPGQGYLKDAPLMWYSAMAAYEAGSDTLSLEYAFQANRTNVTQANLEISASEIRDFLSNFLEENTYNEVIFLGKSIGTNIVSRICGGNFRNPKNYIFQTPLKSTLDFILSAENILVLVGDNDPAFDIDAIRIISNKNNIHAVVFPDANHLLEVEWDFKKSLHNLELATEETYSFVERIVLLSQQK